MDFATGSVSDLTTASIAGFERCFAVNGVKHSEDLENRFADFNLWAAGVGAMAGSEASLDHRFEERPEVLILVKGILALLQQFLDEAASVAERASLVDKDFQDIDSLLEDLTMIAVAIRRTGKRSRLKKADRMFNPEEHEELRLHLQCIVLARTSVGAGSPPRLDTSRLTPVQERLIEANLRRRNRFIQTQRHSMRLALRSNPTKEDKRISIQDADPQAPQPPTAPASSSQLGLSSAEKGVSDVDSDAKWRKHLTEDILPYTCIKADCPAEHVAMFTSHEALEHHVRHEHPSTWECHLCDAGGETFHTMDAITGHFSQNHANISADDFFSTVISSSGQSWLGVQSCPLCKSFSSQDTAELDGHVLEHMHDFSLRSLPWPEHSIPDLPGHVGTFNPDDPWIATWIDALELDKAASRPPQLQLSHEFDLSPSSYPEALSSHAPIGLGYFAENDYFADIKEGASARPQTDHSLSTQPWASSGDPNPFDQSGLCLLSLDGGGIRGLSTLFILKSIMGQLNHERKNSGLPDVLKPCDVFDLIGGTSTGGLIAIMLGRLEMDVDECIAAFYELSAVVLAQSVGRLPVRFINGHPQQRFDSSKLKDTVIKLITSRGLSPEEPYDGGQDHSCKVFVCAASNDLHGIQQLRTYDFQEEKAMPCAIWEAALATSATSGFFDPVQIGSHQYVDGTVAANNPVDQVEREASDIWCPNTDDLKSLVKSFISVGTGNAGGPVEYQVNIPISVALASIATETEEAAARSLNRSRQKYDNRRFFRFNVEQGLQNVGPEEYANRGAIETATEEYLHEVAQKSRVWECVQSLREKRSMFDGEVR